MVVVAEEGRVNHRGTTSRNGRTSHCRRCRASQTTEVDVWLLQRRHLSQYRQRRLGVTGGSKLQEIDTMKQHEASKDEIIWWINSERPFSNLWCRWSVNIIHLSCVVSLHPCPAVAAIQKRGILWNLYWVGTIFGHIVNATSSKITELMHAVGYYPV